MLLEATATAVDAGLGGDDRLSYLETKSGLCVEAEFAVVGVGVVPNVDFLADSGLALDNGVVVNQRFETSVPGVYAAGDVASFFDPLYGRPAANRGLVERELPGTEAGKVLAARRNVRYERRRLLRTLLHSEVLRHAHQHG